jgi:beta-lactamase class A
MGVSRRRLLIGGGSLATLAACSSSPTSTPPSSDPAEPLPPLPERIEALEKRHNAFAGVFASDIDSDRYVEHRANDPFAMCSTFKAYAAGRVLQKATAGELNLTDSVGIEPDDIKPNSPVTETRVGKTMTIAELCEAALQRSDNAAGNWLLRIIGGPSRVTDFARTLGDDKTRLDRWETELNSAVPGDPRDTSTPRALGSGFRSLLVTDVLGDKRQQLETWMRANETSSMRAGLLPRWTSADKTGSGDYGSTNDIGVVYGPNGQRILLAFMARSQADDPNAENLRPLIGELTTLVLPYVSG